MKSWHLLQLLVQLRLPVARRLPVRHHARGALNCGVNTAYLAEQADDGTGRT